MEEEYYKGSKIWFKKLSRYYFIVDLILVRFRKRVVKFVDPPKGSKILDVAAGTGKQAFAFAKKGYDVTGIDLSIEMLDIAKKKNRYKNVKLISADAVAMPFPDGAFDVSYVSFALHDMPISIRESILKEMKRVTRKGGEVVIIDYCHPRNVYYGFLAYHFARLYESPYFPDYMKWDYIGSLDRLKLEFKKEKRSMFGTVHILISSR